MVALLALFVLGGPQVASGLILDIDDAAHNAVPPVPDPGWHYVGHRLGGPTVIYLGYGWVLTASHVGVGVVVFDGQRFDPIKGSDHRIPNEDGTLADIVVYRIEAPPPLPPLRIATRTPMIGQPVILIGHGRLRGPPLTLDLDSKGLIDGYHWLAESHKRWGTNSVVSASQYVTLAGTHTLAIPTVFNRLDDPGATDYEAQAAEGDSGGALFADQSPSFDDSDYALAGLMFTVSSWEGQPRRTSFYGDITYSADLAHYRDAIIAIVRPACSNGLDDDADGVVDYPDDTSCHSEADRTEGPSSDGMMASLRWAVAVSAFFAVGLALMMRVRQLNARHDP